MRALVLSISLLASSSFRLCESSDGAGSSNAASPEPATASASTKEVEAHGKASAKANARIGGSVVMAGDHAVELLPHKSGLIEAEVRDAAGAVVEGGKDVALSVKVAAKGGAEEVKLAWSPEKRCFHGNASAGAELTADPMEIDLSIGGKPMRAKLSEFALLAGPSFGGRMLLAGPYGAEVRAHAGGVRAHLSDALGAEVKGGADLTAEAKVKTSAGVQTLALAYEPAEACFTGRVQAGAEVVPGPIELQVKAGGSAHTGALASLGLEATAIHGGHMVMAGDYSVELAANGDAVTAYVYDASAKAVAGGDLDLDLALGASGEQRVKLVWDPPSASFRGKLGAGVNLKAVPIAVSLKANGRAFAGGLKSLDARANAVASADLKANANAEAALAAGAKVRGPDLKAVAHTKAAKAANASASVKVTPPKVSVSAPKVNVSAKKSASAGTSGGAKASAGFSFGAK